MFEHVIVSVDGGTGTRAVLAPAVDLAWRCGAKLVVVTTAPSAARSSRDLLKAHAMARSGADIDHWVDPGGDPGAAILETVAHRSTPIVCLATRPPEAVRALHQEVARLAPECSCEVVQTTRPAAALVAISSTGTAVVVCPEVGADRRGTLGPFAAEVVATSPQAVLFPPPGA